MLSIAERVRERCIAKNHRRRRRHHEELPTFVLTSGVDPTR